MQQRQDLAEAGSHAPRQERRQTDLGDEIERAPPRPDRSLDGPQVDFGLAAPGDAVQKKRREGSFGEGVLDRFDRFLLIGGGR